VAIAVCVLLGCNEPVQRAEPSASASQAPAPPPTASVPLPPPPTFEGIAPVACTATERTAIARAPGRPSHVAVDPAAVYVASAKDGELTLTRVGKDGQGQKALLRKKAPAPGGLAVDARFVFFTVDGALHVVGRDGGDPEELAKPFGTVIAVDGSQVYGAGVDGDAERVVRMEKDRAVPTPLWRRAGAGVRSIAADGAAVFFTTAEPGQLLTVAAAGGNAMQILGDVPGARLVALDETHLWLATDKALVRMPRLGGPREDWMDGLAADAPLATAAGKAFTRDEGGLVALAEPKAPRPLGVAKPLAITADDRCVYAATEEKGETVVYAVAH
jgi:hypothetical protein